MLGLVVKVSTFNDIVSIKKSAHFPLDFRYSADHSLILSFPLVTCTEETVNRIFVVLRHFLNKKQQTKSKICSYEGSNIM